jgi:hypothetical protein
MARRWYGLWGHRIPVMPDEVATLFVETVTLQPPPAKEAPRPQRVRSRARRSGRSLSNWRCRSARAVAQPIPWRRRPPPAPVVEAPPRPAGPVTLGTELSVACPERRPPAYPPLSRRLGEEGKVVLRVELDEQGAVSSARVATAERLCAPRRGGAGRGEALALHAGAARRPAGARSGDAAFQVRAALRIAVLRRLTFSDWIRHE